MPSTNLLVWFCIGVVLSHFVMKSCRAVAFLFSRKYDKFNTKCDSTAGYLTTTLVVNALLCSLFWYFVPKSVNEYKQIRIH